MGISRAVKTICYSPVVFYAEKSGVEFQIKENKGISILLFIIIPKNIASGERRWISFQTSIHWVFFTNYQNHASIQEAYLSSVILSKTQTLIAD